MVSFVLLLSHLFKLTTDTPYLYLALMGEVWGVYCEDLGKKLQHYNSTTILQDMDKTDTKPQQSTNHIHN